MSPPPQLPPHSLTPFHGVNQAPLNQTFDVSGTLTNLGTAHDAATIAAEVLAAAARPSIEGVPANAGTQ